MRSRVRSKNEDRGLHELKDWKVCHQSSRSHDGEPASIPLLRPDEDFAGFQYPGRSSRFGSGVRSRILDCSGGTTDRRSRIPGGDGCDTELHRTGTRKSKGRRIAERPSGKARCDRYWAGSRKHRYRVVVQCCSFSHIAVRAVFAGNAPCPETDRDPGGNDISMGAQVNPSIRAFCICQQTKWGE